MRLELYLPDNSANILLDVNEILQEKAWTSLKDVRLDSEVRGRSSTGKGGLINLGSIMKHFLRSET